jgi:DNA-binding response OmpR family regulator
MNETILIVDDSPDIVLFLKQYILMPLGYKVLTASDGQSGLDIALANKPDLIMLDMNMPRMTGLQMLVALRQTEVQCPVIFMTLHGSEHIAVEVFRLGVRDYLVKPFTVEEVERAVDRALQEVRLAREKEELARNLAASDAVRQTVITMAHYINNNLMVLSGGMAILKENCEDQKDEQVSNATIIRDCITSLSRIEAVMRVLQKVTNIREASYHGNIRMLDIEKALKDELHNASDLPAPAQ